MKWSDGSHRPRRMTVEEFEAWNVPRTTVIKAYNPDGTRNPERDMGVMIFGVSHTRGRGIRLKTRLSRWDRWRDRQWEARQREGRGQRI